MRSVHYKRFSKSKRSKSGGTKRAEGHKRKRPGESRKKAEKWTTRELKGVVGEDEVVKPKAPVKRLQTAGKAAQTEVEAEALPAQATQTLGDREADEVEVESGVAVAGEERDVAISPRLHDEYGSGSVDLEEHRTQRDIGHTVYGVECMIGGLVSLYLLT